MSICYFFRYKYEFPFLETRGVVTVDDNRVGPLYKHVFPPALAPWLSFVGLPWKVVPLSGFFIITASKSTRICLILRCPDINTFMELMAGCSFPLV